VAYTQLREGSLLDSPGRPALLGSKVVSARAAMVARDGVEWNYAPLDGLILYPR